MGLSFPLPGGPCNRAYERRRPEENVLYRTVEAGLETFLARARSRDRTVPRFVERAFRGFLRCGILEHGFLRVHCDACGHDRLVALNIHFHTLVLDGVYGSIVCAATPPARRWRAIASPRSPTACSRIA